MTRWNGPFTPIIVKIRFRIRMLFQKNKPLTSPAATKLELQKGYRVSASGFRLCVFYVAQILCVTSGWTCSSGPTRGTSSYRGYLNGTDP